MRSMDLVRLCKADDDKVVDHLAQLMAKFSLIEWPSPDPEPVPPEHDGSQALTLGQMRTWLRDRYGAGMRVYIRPGGKQGQMIASARSHGIWLVLHLNGFLWYGDATDMIREMDWSGLPEPAPNEPQEPVEDAGA